MGCKIKTIMHHPPAVERRSGDISFASRSPFHKFARIFYKVMRAFYVSLVFYFVPFAVLLGQWVAPLKLKKNQLGHTSSENKLTLPTPGEAEPAPDFWTM